MQTPQIRPTFKKKLPRLLLAFLITAAAGAVVEIFALSYTAATKLVHPKRTVSVRTPSDFGMPYEDVQFTGPDDTVIKAWFIPGRIPAAIILVHGYGGDKGSLLEIAEFLRRRGGFSLLVPDMRASGESDGRSITAGYYERGDVQEAVRYLKGRPDVDGERIGAFGESMGASIALLAAADEDGIRTVVADSPYRSVSDLLYHSFERIFGLPRFPFEAVAVRLAEREAGLPINAVAPVREISKISPRAVLLVHGSADPLVPAVESEELFRAAGEPKELWIVEGAGHAEAFTVAREQYEAKVTEFFQRYLK